MRKLTLLVALLALAVAGFTGATASAAKPAGTGGGGGGATLTVPFTGTFTDTVNGGLGTVTGTFTLDRFTTQGGALAVVGTVDATLKDSLGAVIGTVEDQLVTIPVTNLTGSCDILHLELGPIDLDLLGLVVHVNQIVIDIDAQSGPGNLLGNLLCGIAGLLDQGVPVNQLANLLNQLLALLQ